MKFQEIRGTRYLIIPGRLIIPVSRNWWAMLTLTVVVLLLGIGCGVAEPAVTPSPGIEPAESSPDPVAPATPAASPAGLGTPQVSARPMTVTIGEGSVARYLVREQLARLEFPNDAIGQTSEISGVIAFDSSGKVISEASSIVVNLASLTSDEDRRDNFLRTRTLESRDFPAAEFVVREAPGLAWPLPDQGEASFQLAGDMTLHGVTRPLTWDATVQFNNGAFTGSARTSFPFEDFDLDVPRLAILLSVENNIRLELELAGSVS